MLITMQKFVPPSFEEATIYGGEIGLPESECERWWYFYDARNWMVGRVKMSRWKSAMALWFRDWKSKQFHQAAIQNTRSGAETVILGREYERILEAMKSIQSGYDSHRDMLPDDVVKFNWLKTRRDELRKILGIKV